jgi:WD40 repeat protein
LLFVVASKTVNINIPLSTSEVIYSLRLYDPDLDEEVWIDEAAHHGIIYDMKWSKNDRFLLTCSNDSSCKVWDLLALHPLMQQYSPPSDEDQSLLLQQNHSPGSHGYATVPGDEQSVAENSHYPTHNHYLTPRNVVKQFPPKIHCVFRLPSKVYSYCGLFQESLQSRTTSATDPSGYIWNQLLEYHVWKEQMTTLQANSLPHVIIGCSDGRLRVFEYTSDQVPSATSSSSMLLGYISVKDKDEAGNVIDIPPHNGTVNSLVIDERSR